MMGLDWTAEGDFASVVDTLEPVTLRRECGLPDLEVGNAWRFSESKSEVRGTESAVVQHDAVWQLPFSTEDEAPHVGDRLLEASGVCWTLTQVELLQGSTRYRCQAKRVAIRPDAAEWIDQQRAVWQEVEVEGVPTPTITGWTTERQALRGHIWRTSTEVVGAEGESVVEHFRIAFTEPVVVTPNHRFRSHVGGLYRVVDSELSRGLGDSWTVLVSRAET